MNFNEPFWHLLPSSNREMAAHGKGSQSFTQCPVQTGTVISEVLSVLGGWELCEVKTKGEPHDSGTCPRELLFEQMRLWALIPPEDFLRPSTASLLFLPPPQS